MLLAKFWCGKIGDFGGVGGGVGKAIGIGMRDAFDGVIGREAIPAHDIGFLGVVSVVACGEIGVEGEEGGAFAGATAEGVGVAGEVVKES